MSAWDAKSARRMKSALAAQAEVFGEGLREGGGAAVALSPYPDPLDASRILAGRDAAVHGGQGGDCNVGPEAVPQYILVPKQFCIGNLNLMHVEREIEWKNVTPYDCSLVVCPWPMNCYCITFGCNIE